MFSAIKAFVIGTIGTTLYLLNLIVVPISVILIEIIARIIPMKAWYKFWSRINHAIPALWTDINTLIMKTTANPKIVVHGEGKLHKKGWFFLICNHQSWADILIVQRVFNHKLPFIKFFMKEQLKWAIPIAGIACWIMGFPFMKRYSKSYLKKHPEKKGKDLELTKKSMRKI